MSSQTESPNWVYGTKSSFSAGELTPPIEGRADLPLYQNGAKKIINWMILPSGGLTRRPGTEFIWAESRVPERPVKVVSMEGSSTDSSSTSEGDSMEGIDVTDMPVPSSLVPDASVPTVSGAFFDYGILDEEDELYGRNLGLMSSNDIKNQSLKVVKGEVGRRQIPGWTLQDVEDNGNCFYDAVAHQMKLIGHGFLRGVPEGTLPRDSLRLHIQGENFRDEEWTEDRAFDEFVKKIDVILAIIDTRSSENGYVYYYLGDHGEVVTHVRDNENPLPVKSYIKLAATGDHFLSVVSEAFEGEGQGGIGNIDPLSEAPLK